MAFALCLLTINAQKLYTFHNVTMYWNHATKQWDYNRQSDAKITFEMAGDYLIANDAAHSRYYLTEIVDESDGFFSCKAIDENGRSCVIMISNNDEGVDKIAIMYGDTDVLHEYWFYF